MADDTLSETWLATRLGLDPREVDAMRRGGELIAVRRPGGQEWRYPAWQFRRGFERIPGIERVVAAGRDAGLDDERLASLLSLKAGMTSGRPLAGVVREGRVDHVGGGGPGGGAPGGAGESPGRGPPGAFNGVGLPLFPFPPRG